MTLMLSTPVMSTLASSSSVRGCATLPKMSGSLDRDLFAERMRASRKARGMSQAGLAEAIDVSTETISRIERGAYEASLASAVGIAAVLGVELDYLVGAKGKKSRRTNPPPSPVADKLVARVAQLPASAQKAVLRLVEHLPTK